MLERARQVISELIGQAKRLQNYAIWRFNRSALTPTRDWAQADYAFWDKARWARAQGLELSGLFLKPLSSKIASWVLGVAPQWKLENSAAQDKLTEWWTEHHHEVLQAYEEATALGDCYLVINADLSLTMVSPDVVEPIVAEDDFSRIVGWRIVQNHPHPTDINRTMQVVDEYTDRERIRTVTADGKETVTRYRNLLGICPMIHISNEPRSNEIFGRPEGYALLGALHRYGEVFDAALDGNIRQGRPTPVAKMEDSAALDKFFETYGRSKTVEHADGTSETFTEIDFDSDNFLALLGDFEWKGPGSFSKDTEVLLGLIFYLILQHSEIPEFVWGNAIASSKASAESQMPPFIRWIEKRRGQAAGWLTDVARVVLAYYALWEPGMTADAPALQWESLTDDDGRLTLDTVSWAYAEGLLDRETALQLAPVEIQDIPGVLARAEQERDKEEQRQEERNAALGFDRAIDNLERDEEDEALERAA